MLNGALARAQKACCEQIQPSCARPRCFGTLDQRWLDDFADSGRCRAKRQAARVAIVDEHPTGQYLYPEFPALSPALPRRRYRDAVICDPPSCRSSRAACCMAAPIDLTFTTGPHRFLPAGSGASALRAQPTRPARSC